MALRTELGVHIHCSSICQQHMLQFPGHIIRRPVGNIEKLYSFSKVKLYRETLSPGSSEWKKIETKKSQEMD